MNQDRTLTSNRVLAGTVGAPAGSTLAAGTILKANSVVFSSFDVTALGGTWTGTGPFTLSADRTLTSPITIAGLLSLAFGSTLVTGTTLKVKANTYTYNEVSGMLATQTTADTSTSFTTRPEAFGAPVTMTNNAGTFYYLTNAHGDVLAMYDGAGKIVASWAYDAWGNPTEYAWVYDTNGTLTAKNQVAVGTFGNPYLYAGYFYDVETSMYYLNARYYSPRTGRFISRDAAPQMATERLALNAYAYTENNPVTRTDPSGHYTQEDLERATKQVYDAISQDPAYAYDKFGNEMDWGAEYQESLEVSDWLWNEWLPEYDRANADRQWYQQHSLGSLAENPGSLPEMCGEREVSDIAYNMLTGKTGINMQNGLRLTGSAAVAMGVGMPGSKYEHGGTWEPGSLNNYSTTREDILLADKVSKYTSLASLTINGYASYLVTEATVSSMIGGSLMGPEGTLATGAFTLGYGEAIYAASPLKLSANILDFIGTGATFYSDYETHGRFTQESVFAGGLFIAGWLDREVYTSTALSALSYAQNN